MRSMKRGAANRYVQSLASQLHKFDYVNIQFESGLFGILPRDIMKRFYYLYKASRKLIVTMHRVDVKKPFFSVAVLHSFTGLQIRHLLKQFISTWRNNKLANINIKISKLCIKKNAHIIVHTQREKYRILSISRSKAKVADHPLAYLTLDEAKNYKDRMDKQQYLTEHNLPEDAIIIGTFGFIAPYKGIPVLMKCLPFLPENFHVMVFGSQHPLKISDEPEGDFNVKKYIGSLLGSSNKMQNRNNKPPALGINYQPEMAKRFHFLGGFFDHEDFIRAMTSL